MSKWIIICIYLGKGKVLSLQRMHRNEKGNFVNGFFRKNEDHCILNRWISIYKLLCLQNTVHIIGLMKIPKCIANEDSKYDFEFGSFIYNVHLTGIAS